MSTLMLLFLDDIKDKDNYKSFNEFDFRSHLTSNYS